MSDEPEQPVLRVIGAIEGQILTKQLVAHGKLPSIRDLAEQLDVAYNTVQNGLKELRAKGLVYSHKGKGSFVAPKAFELLTGADVDRSLAERVEHLEQALAKALERLDRLDGGGSEA
ncbi:GntR family transcriptional regulator [Streptomyces sp. S1D4-20]|uniref:GntR family transcriptional regulator n=1 Tax=Streptomyces sp. S1D4-20 TaxID=2594462 RepID=UPI0013DFD377|nr:GntR family transcriptional regulator [Streptomyces sp. S1D4-20]